MDDDNSDGSDESDIADEGDDGCEAKERSCVTYQREAQERF